jgi:Malectin domain
MEDPTIASSNPSIHRKAGLRDQVDALRPGSSVIMRSPPFFSRLLRLLAGVVAAIGCWSVSAQGFSIVQVSPQASPKTTLAAHEFRRYAGLRTGQWPAIVAGADAPAAGSVVIAVAGDALASQPVLATAGALGSEQYVLATTTNSADGGRIWWVIGGDDQGALYGVYRFSELLGVRFYLDRDVISDAPWAGPPVIQEIGRPLYKIRGFLPYHNFPDGADWWSRDGYLAFVAQAVKLRCNFVGFHDYPDGGFNGASSPGALLWYGLPRDVDFDGHPLWSHPGSLADNADGSWGYQPGPTGEFSGGAAGLFPADYYSSDVLSGLIPFPMDPAGAAQVYDRVGGMLGAFVAEARGLGVKTGVGADLLYTHPWQLEQRLQNLGYDTWSQQTMDEIYLGMEQRLWRTAPFDYHFVWTPEGWLWWVAQPADMAKGDTNYLSAVRAWQANGKRMQLAAGGWILGPQNDPTRYHRALPLEVPMGAFAELDGAVGPDKGNLALDGREKWFFPWLERDAELTSLQLWTGRTLHDAAMARLYQCDGLIGLHWRTRWAEPMASAMAGAAWDQSYVPDSFKKVHEGEGGTGTITYAVEAPIRGAADPRVYQSLRGDTQPFYYFLKAPNGSYSVTVNFAETWFKDPGRRQFDVQCQGRFMVTNIDLVALAGANTAYDLGFSGVPVTEGWLCIQFGRGNQAPIVSGIVLTNTATGFVRRINCGGGAISGYEADQVFPQPASDGVNRSMDPTDVYRDFASAQFGASVAEAAGAILSQIDGVGMPRVPIWWQGPGALVPNASPWSLVKPRYAFADQFTALRPLVTGEANLDRFDAWSNQLQLMSAEAAATCARGLLDNDIQSAAAASNSQARRAMYTNALADRIALTRAWDEMIQLHLASVSTPGDLGEVANFELHTRKALQFLSADDARLTNGLGVPLPPEVQPSMNYSGPDRLIVPTVRTLAHFGEDYQVTAIVQSSAGPSGPPALDWRSLGASNSWFSSPMTLVGRSTFVGAVRSVSGDFEFRVRAGTTSGASLVWPVGDRAQTVVAWTPPVRPSRPTGLRAFAGGTGGVGLTLLWDAVTNASTYTLRRAATPDGPFEMVASNLTTTAFFDASAGDQPAFYVISASNESFESVDSAVIAASTTPYSPPPRTINVDAFAHSPYAGTAVIPGVGPVWNEMPVSSNRLERLSDASGMATEVNLEIDGGAGAFAPGFGWSAPGPATAGLFSDGLASPTNGVATVTLSGLPPSSACILAVIATGATFTGAVEGMVVGWNPASLLPSANYLLTNSTTDAAGRVTFSFSTAPGAGASALHGIQIQWSPPAIVSPPLLRIEQSVTGPVLIWQYGQLSSAVSPEGPFQVLDARSPFSVKPDGVQRFFRVQ